MLDSPLMVAAALAAVVLLVGSPSWADRRRERILARWATANHFQIVSCERRHWLAGPYVFRRGEGQEVLHLMVEDALGSRRSGCVRIGGFFVGLMSDAVDVTWDDER